MNDPVTFLTFETLLFMYRIEWRHTYKDCVTAIEPYELNGATEKELLIK